jgi:ElaB/YqjD/DUF883 family membrane-anchored ribosome-binding protein
MALAIPIITEFDGKGISKAITEFKNLETNGQKAHFAITKAALPATAALAGLTAALGASVKAAIEDAASQNLLAKQLQRTTNATDAQIEGVEDYITVQGKLLGVTDDQLRPALAGLVRATGSITEAQKAATLAMDVAIAKNVSLETVTKTLERAYGGNFTALAKLSPELRDMIKAGASLDEVMAKMSETFGGAASDAADTAAGKFKRLKVSLDETKESIGAALLPAVEAVLPYLQSFAQWAQDNPGAFLAIAAAIGVISGAIVTYTVAAKIATGVNALLATSFTALQVASGLIVFTAIIVGIIALYKNFEWFRNGIKSVVNNISDYFEFMGNGWVKASNIIIRGINLINPFKDIPKIPNISIGRIGEGGNKGDGGNGRGGFNPPAPGLPVSTATINTPGAGSVTPPRITGGGGTGDMSMGFGGGISGLGEDFSPTININAGLISSPATVGQEIIDAILAAQRNSGTVFAPAT